MGETEIEITLTKHGEQLKTLEHRVDRVENISQELNKLTINIEKLTMSVNAIVKSQEKQADDIESLKLQPGRTAKDMWIAIAKAAATAIVGALIGALIAIIIKK